MEPSVRVRECTCACARARTRARLRAWPPTSLSADVACSVFQSPTTLTPGGRERLQSNSSTE